MVGSGAGVGDNRSKEAVGMMALHESLRNVCLSSDWTYSVFWTIRPRPRCRGGNGCKVGDDNGSLMLMWEDGFCRTADDFDGAGDDPVRKAFSKMSIQLYNYGEGLMGKVASDKCHKWVFKEPSECEPNNISNYWQSSFDAIPQEWTEQFASGIQTIAVIQAGHGLLQLGSCKIIAEDLHFVLRMRHMFESLAYQSGFYLSQLFSSARSSPPPPMPKQNPVRSLPSWALQRPVQPAFIASPTAIRTSRVDEPIHMFLPLMGAAHPSPPTPSPHDLDGGGIDPDLKWPNGLSFFTALTGRPDESKLLFSDGPHQRPLALAAPSTKEKLEHDHGECGSSGADKMDQSFKFKRSFTLPSARGASSPLDASSYVPTAHPGGGNGAAGDGIYSDIMETFLE